MLTIATENRKKTEKPNALRKAGKLPAVYYGRKQASTPITVSAVEFSKVLKKAGESTVVTLKMAQGDMDSLIYGIDRDPVSDTIRHADFYVFEKDQKIKIKIPLEFTGVSPAVKELGAVLVKVLREVEIEATPKDLPHVLNVDISKLVTFENQVLAKDILLPAGVTLIAKPDEVVASVYEPKEEVVEVAPVDLSAIEVEKKGKEAKEGEEGAAVAAEGAAAPKKEDKKEPKK
ncbi:MAG: 50S ribosomal protein L25 [Candidatus Kaiserbacteria bacterium GW2011_GWA2_49_19]|uniref:Large ribosomal subunit protein bL25 n=1 Tax=Candidatus Kaiserbacteria bacterium GW2011_GWA2_49_19 TaxID=1618669 RepID=A0A0G1VSM4_9BACT|nr:MAG: 50S ribosomal protein L25 [Candidatus Kaiserbacteria bacterium GW2011_GWA2_49_19]